MKTTKPWAVLLLIIVTTLPENADTKMPAGAVSVNEHDLVLHIRRVLSREKRDVRWKRAPQLAQIIMDEANRYEIDPLVLTVIVQTESTFQEGMLRGKDGEIGLTQLLGAAKHCDKTADLRTSRGQIRGGACWYAYSLRLCKTENRALHGYQSGYCDSKSYGPLHRSRIIRRARIRIWHRNKEVEDLLNPLDNTHTGKAEYAEQLLPPSLSAREQLML